MENPMGNPMDEQQFPPQPERAPEEKPATESYGFAPRPSRRGLITVIAAILLLTVAGVFVRGTWLRITDTEVTGLITYSK